MVFKKRIFLKDIMQYDDIYKTPYHPVVDGNYLFHRNIYEEVNGYDEDL
jgi:hypothetical protein